MATLPTLKLEDTPAGPIRVYKGTRKAQQSPYHAKIYGPNADEEYYVDENGKEIRNFDPKTHTVFGTIGEGGKRIPSQTAGVAGSSDIDPYEGKSAQVQAAMNAGRPVGDSGIMAGPSTSRPAKINPADVKANAAIPAPQKSIAEEQADYIRRRGGRTAADVSAQDAYNGQMNYKEMTGFDISTAEGRRQSENAALLRGGHAHAMARNLRAGKYAYLDPNTDAGMKARDTAYQKAWGPEGQFDKGVRAGENPLTGQYKVTLDGPAYVSKELYDMTRGAEDEATDYANNAINAALNPPPPEPTFSWEQPNFNATADRLRLSGIKPAPDSQFPYGPLTAEQQAEGDRETKYVDDVLNQIRTGNEIDNNVRRAAASYRKAQSQSQGMGKVIRPDGTTAYQEIEPEYTTEDYVKRGADMLRDSQITERSMREGFIPAKGATRYTQPIGPAPAPAGYRPPQPAQGPRHPTVEFLDRLKADAEQRANAPRQAAEQMRRMDASGTKWNGGIPANKVYGPNKNPPMFPRGWIWDSLNRNFGIKNPF